MNVVFLVAWILILLLGSAFVIIFCQKLYLKCWSKTLLDEINDMCMVNGRNVSSCGTILAGIQVELSIENKRLLEAKAMLDRVQVWNLKVYF